MSSHALLEHLQSLGVSLETDGDTLKVKAGKGTISPELLSRMKAQKAGLIALLSRAAGTSYPQSSNQSQLWFLDQLEPGNPMYNNPLALKLEGVCDPAALQRAVDKVIMRHSILRTVFFDRDGAPWQRVLDQSPTTLEITDLTQIASENQQQRIEQLVRAHAERPFDLASEPAIRTSLLKLSPHCHILLLNVHHICADGWSIGILLDELMHIYTTTVTGAQSQLPVLKWQYSDFVVEQHNRLNPTEIARQKEYWTNQLSGAPDMLELPTDRPRPALQSYNGAHLEVRLPPALRPRLQALSHASNATPFALFLAVHAIIMTRYANQDDICIGSPLAGRNRQELEPLIGHFIHTVALRARLSGNPRFVDFLADMHDTVLGAVDHQDIAFEKVVEAVNPVRSASHAPLFQTMLIFQNTPQSQPKALGDLRFTPLNTDSGTAKYDITLELFQDGDTYTLGFEYNTDLFDALTMQRLADQFQTVLQAVLDDPTMCVHDVPLTTPTPLTGPSPTHTDTDTDTASVHACFSRIATRFQDNIAVQDDTNILTFAELEIRARAVCAHLQSCGIPARTRIALMMQPDTHYVALLLGILKMGCIFVPVDPDTPTARLSHILEDGDINHVFADTTSREKLAQIRFDGEIFAPDAAGEPDAMISLPQVNPEDPAALIFTSGSTGRPKGAVVTHGGLTNLAQWTRQTFPLDGPVLQKSSIGFDASLWEFIWPMLSGRTLIIAQADDRKNPGILGRKITDQNIAAVQFVPATLRLFLDGLEDTPCLSLQYIFCGGGVLSTDLARAVTARLPHVQLINVYGVTESSVDSTYHVYDPVKDKGQAVPIGLPIFNTSLMLLDALQRPVPQGAIGELCIGGQGVGLGYVNASNDTFRSGLAGYSGDWFMTGDLARMNSAGELEFANRRDFQIKLNGFRIEPGEIEGALQHCGCTGAVVIAHHDILVAYITGDPDPVSLRSALAERLPDYMIPGLMIPLAEFPLNASGKIDRKALPDPKEAMVSNAVNQSTPRDAMELELYNIWKSILLHPGIGIRDNFFNVGGSSISAIKMLHLIKQKTGVALGLRSIIANPTIEDLAGLMRTGGDATQGEEPLITFQQGSGKGHVVCVHPAGGTAFCYLSLAKALDDGLGVYGLQSPGLNAGEVLAHSVEEMARQYLALIRDLPEGPMVITGLSFGGLVAHEMGRLLALEGSRQVSVVLLDTQGTHDTELRRRIDAVEMEEFREKLVRFNGTYPGISDGQIERYFEVYNHNRLTVRDYEVPVSHARIAFIQARSDLPRHFLHEVRRYWRSRTTNAFHAKLVRGDHWDMLETNELRTVQRVISSELEIQTKDQEQPS